MSQGENDNDLEWVLQSLTTDIARKIHKGAQKTESISSSACINWVPEELRKLKESAYTPRLVAIGPLHRNDERLQTHMHHVKMSYTNYLLSRLTARMEDQELAEQKKFTVLQECVAQMKTSLDDAKKCYASDVLLDEEMMLVDGCFILEFLYRVRLLHFTKWAEENENKPNDGGDNSNSQGRKTDIIFGNSLTIRDVQNDLVLLENQIPFFVLEKLFKLTVDLIPNCHDKWSLTDYVWWCYHCEWMSPIRNSYMLRRRRSSLRDCVLRVFCSTTAAEVEEVQSGNIDDNRTTANYYHILHNLHDGYFTRDQKRQKKPREGIFMPSASELFYAGVKFVPSTANNQFKVKFVEPGGLFWWFLMARFEIPPLAISDDTESFLRNLIAFEQSCPGISKHVSSYAILMIMLVNSDTDVRLLEKAGVVRNYLGPTEDATYLFKNLSKETFVTEYFFADACSEATKYSRRFWPTQLAHVRRAFFANPGPWQFVALWVSFIALVVSFLQLFTDFIKNGECGCPGTKRSS